MKSKLSALLDGEAEESDVSAVCEALRRQPGLCDDGVTYGLIGACLRGESSTQDVVRRVMAAVAAEPVVMAPTRTLWGGGWLALAASIAGVAVVVAAVLAPAKDLPSGYTLAHSSSDMPPSRAWAMNDVRAGGLKEADVREYLIAHEAQSRGSYLGGSSQQIRTVSMLEESGGR